MYGYESTLYWALRRIDICTHWCTFIIGVEGLGDEVITASINKYTADNIQQERCSLHYTTPYSPTLTGREKWRGPAPSIKPTPSLLVQSPSTWPTYSTATARCEFLIGNLHTGPPAKFSQTIPGKGVWGGGGVRRISTNGQLAGESPSWDFSSLKVRAMTTSPHYA